MSRTLIVLFVSAIFVVSSDSARILGLFITPSKSHLIVHGAITDALAERGHNVTVVTTIPLLRKNPLYRHIQLDVPSFPPNFFSEMINNPQPLHKRLGQMMEVITDYGTIAMNQPPMKKLMEEESFDLVIYGYFFNEFLLGVAGALKCPVIISFMIQPVGFVSEVVGNPKELAYVPSLFGGGKQPLQFFGRVKNFLFVTVIDQGLLKYALRWTMSRTYSANFPPDKYRSFEEMKKNISLVLTNHHFSQTPIRPNVPALIEIGGIQIKDKPDPLPEDLQTILNNSSKHGAIYFSFGSNVQGTHLDPAKAKIMFDVLSKMPQTVLWKWDGTNFPGQSPNIVYKSWLPQDDILAHPNVKLFVTHGGQGSVVESQYHGVPMVGIPLFGEQKSNMENVQKEGFGLTLDYLTLSEEGLSNAINEVLTNSKYAENVQRFARLYKDRPMTAKETAVFWVEYVLRHHGAPHMQSPAVHLNVFQLSSLDVIGFLVAVIYIAFKLIKVIFSLIFRRKSRKVKNKRE